MAEISFSPSHLKVSKANKRSYMTSPASEQYPTIAKVALLESRRMAIEENRSKLFSEEKKQNSSKLNINKSCSKEFVEQLCNQHRIQVQKLLLEISRLHDLVQDLQRQNRHQVNRIKEQSDQLAMIRISSLRQSQLEQIEALQLQMKSYKKNYNFMQEEYQSYKSSTQKKLQELSRENREQKDLIKKLVEEKNNQIFNQKKKNEKQVEKIIVQKQIQMGQLRECMEKQMRKIKGRLEGRQRQISILKGHAGEQKEKFEEFEKLMVQEKEELLQKLEVSISKQKKKQDDAVKSLKKFYEESMAQLQEQNRMGIQDFQKEIDQLMSIITLKNQQLERNIVYRETQKLQSKFMYNFFQEEIKYLRQSLKKQRKSGMQQTELLKTKMALLHENDVSSLTKMYEKRIQDLVITNRRNEQLLETAENKLISSKKQFYDEKKRFDYKISKLQEQIIRLRLGMGSIQHQMKEKLDNQKSMLLFTSKNFVKQVQIKSANNKFYEEQLRKLRHLLDIQANELEQSERNVEEKIKLAEDQLTRLSNKILEVKSEADQAQQKYKSIIHNKDCEIKRLNDLLNIPQQEVKERTQEKQEILKLQAELNRKLDELGNTRMRCQQLQDQIRILKTEGERLMLEAQMNSDDAKKHYKAISDKNLLDMKNFYERRIKDLQNDKKQFERINSNQTEQITELIKKYNEVEDSLKELINQSKKRGDLQHRIIHLGMDHNLVKNMAELFKK